MSPKTHRTEMKESPIISKHRSIVEILADHELASLGDAYVNFVYSLALSRKMGRPIGKKVNSSTLASALRKANLRRFLPLRTDRHKQADAAESLIVYAWLAGAMSLGEMLSIIEEEEKEEDMFALLLRTISVKLNVTHGKV